MFYNFKISRTIRSNIIFTVQQIDIKKYYKFTAM